MKLRQRGGEAERRNATVRGLGLVAAVLTLSAFPPPRLSAQADMDPEATAARYRAALTADSLDVEASWRLAVALVNIGKRTPDDRPSPGRDSLYREAELHARRAGRLAPDDANAQFAMALALGRSALTRGARERVRYALAVREHAERALELDPGHDGAWHVLGRWHAEVKRLSALDRFVARHLLGGGPLAQASWDESVRCLTRAVALRPDHIYHRLDLAEVLVELKRDDEARPHLVRIADLPAQDAMDHVYRARAGVLLTRMVSP